MVCNTKYSISHVSTNVLWDKAVETKSFWLIVYYYLQFRQVKLELKSLNYVRISRSTSPASIFHFWFYLILSLFFKISLCEKCPNTEFFLVRVQPEYEKIRTRKNSALGHFSRRVWLTGLIRMSEKCSLRNLFSIGF